MCVYCNKLCWCLCVDVPGSRQGRCSARLWLNTHGQSLVRTGHLGGLRASRAPLQCTYDCKVTANDLLRPAHSVIGNCQPQLPCHADASTAPCSMLCRYPSLSQVLSLTSEAVGSGQKGVGGQSAGKAAGQTDSRGAGQACSDQQRACTAHETGMHDYIYKCSWVPRPAWHRARQAASLVILRQVPGCDGGPVRPHLGQSPVWSDLPHAQHASSGEAAQPP